jgi:demethylspheroidene O-methyltransferase
MRLLVAARAALAGRGQVLIAEPLAQTRGAEAMGHGYFGMYLLAMGQGRPRTKAELTQMARAAGFRRVRERRVAQPVLVRVLVVD